MENITDTGNSNLETQNSPVAVAAPDDFLQASNGLSNESRVRLANAGVEAGDLTREEADALLAETGHIASDEKGVKIETEGRAGELDAAFPPAKAHEFSIPDVSDGEPLSQKHVDIVNQSQKWLEAGRFPREIGNSLAQLVHEAATKFKGMSPEEREFYIASERSILKNVLREDTGRKMGLASELISELETVVPGMDENLFQSGAIHSAAVVAVLANHAAVLDERRNALEAASKRSRH